MRKSAIFSFNLGVFKKTILSLLFVGMTCMTQITNANLVYVTNNTSGDLSVIDSSTNSVVATIPIAQYLVGVAITPDSQFIYVANANTGFVYVLDALTYQIVTTIHTTGVIPASGAFQIAFTPNGEFAYVTNENNGTFSFINTQTFAVSAPITPSSGSAFGIGITPDGKFAFLCGGSVTVFNTSSNAEVFQIPGVSVALRVAFTPDGKYAYIPSLTNASPVYVVDTGTFAISTTISLPLGSFPYSVAITPNGKYAYVTTTAGTNTVYVIDTGTNTVSATIAIPGPVGSHEIAITPDGNFAYITNPASNTTSVISLLDNQFIETVPVGTVPLGIAIAQGPLAPSNLTGTQKKEDFGVVYQYFNSLHWEANPSSQPASTAVGYYVYRNGIKIATLSATTFKFTDNNVKRGITNTYTVTAFDVFGNEGTPLSIVIK